MVVAQQQLAETSGYEQGVAVLGGGRVGPDTVDLIRCTGLTETITTDGHDITHHGSTTSIRPSLRRAVLARDDGCTIDGCTSTYRLEVHHIIPVSQGGNHIAANLTARCWWHHHVAVRRRGMRIDPQSPPRRRRLLPPRHICGHQPPDPDPHTLAILRALHVPTKRAPP
ncbi:MAG: HNH endonuclease signature motif containing protein [bacterium]|nr:HNH endonuclease signature motif containing protein [bacterium]MDE0287648.1 HNH endonuclease signature motif containing protein [bacterium]MDE0438407.1 HNH endonuclease signature motif containing protein [bacterium]